jgi:hypothetical protein
MPHSLSITDTQHNNDLHNAECNYAELSVLFFVMLSFIMRNVIMLRVVMLNIVCSVSWRPCKSYHTVGTQSAYEHLHSSLIIAGNSRAYHNAAPGDSTLRVCSSPWLQILD